MLMTTRSDRSNLTNTLKLDGTLFGSWIGELESACRRFLVHVDRVCLDLGGLTFVDEEEARVLKRLSRDGTRVIACSGFVAEILRHERP
jgi:hypothetical protein